MTIRLSDFCEDAVSKSLRLPREKHFEPQKTSRDPGVFAVLISASLSRAGVVQILPTSTSKSVPTSHFLTVLTSKSHFERQKTLRACQFLTILTSKSLSRAGVVQILSSSTSKSAPGMPVFNDFDFQIVFARRRGANFVELNFQPCSRHASF